MRGGFGWVRLGTSSATLVVLVIHFNRAKRALIYSRITVLWKLWRGCSCCDVCNRVSTNDLNHERETHRRVGVGGCTKPHNERLSNRECFTKGMHCAWSSINASGSGECVMVGQKTH